MDIFAQNFSIFLVSLTNFNLILFVVIVILLLVFLMLLKNIYKAYKQELDAFEEAQVILRDAEAKSISIIEQANKRAVKLISQSKVLTEQDKIHILDSIKQIADKNNKIFDEVLGQLRTHFSSQLVEEEKLYLQKFKSFEDSINKKLDTQLETMALDIKHDLKTSESILNKKVSTKYEEIEKELEDYKKLQLEELKKEVNYISQKVFKELIERSINEEDHLKLIDQLIKQVQWDKYEKH